ncbi:hypothetical protein BT93_B0069 [Corymbia citriodora subsp. variegata]|nr:hypothetical protein BT93_B0069 [Corymbia citriodora subsp. variegata]
MKVTVDGEKTHLNSDDRSLNCKKLREEMRNEEKPPELHSIEFLFKDKEIPPWQSQITLRALVMDLMFGMIPPVNLYAGFFGFLFIKAWTKLLSAAGLMGQPFTRQENVVIQVCVNAIFTISFKANAWINPNDIKNPSFGWMTLFLLLSSSAGLFALLPLRKVMIIDKKLTFPIGFASANFINSFHAPRHGKWNGRKQIRQLRRFFTISFLWSIFQWLYSGGHSCGFHYFPTFGLKAFQKRYGFTTYIGIGMMCPFAIIYSQLLGAILSSGVLWPYIQTKSGDWYPTKVAPGSLDGLQAYMVMSLHNSLICKILILSPSFDGLNFDYVNQVFISLSIIIGDGVYNLIKIIVIGLFKHKSSDNFSALIVAANPFHGKTPVSYDEEVRNKTFLEDQIPKRVAMGGYVAIAITSVAVFPFIFPSLRWYHVLTLYLISPLVGFCIAYVTAISDLSVSSVFGRTAILIFSSWTRKSSGSVLAGLTACGLLMHLVDAASNMMASFKLGHMTLSSPKSLFLSQLIGTLVGCFVSPCVFLYFKNHYPDGFGTPDSMFPAAWASSQRTAAMRATNGFSTLPKHCLSLSLAFFLAAILVSLLRDSTPKKWKNLVPMPMAFALSFNVKPFISIDLCVGYLIFYVRRRKNKNRAEALAPFVGPALMFGEGLWWFPSTILKMWNVIAPMCMMFLSKEMRARAENCLNSGS